MMNKNLKNALIVESLLDKIELSIDSLRNDESNKALKATLFCLWSIVNEFYDVKNDLIADESHEYIKEVEFLINSLKMDKGVIHHGSEYIN